MDSFVQIDVEVQRKKLFHGLKQNKAKICKLSSVWSIIPIKTKGFVGNGGTKIKFPISQFFITIPLEFLKLS